MLCPRCGTKLGAGVTFCFNCNSDLRQATPASGARARARETAQATVTDVVFPLKKPAIWLLNIFATPISGAVLYYAWRRRHVKAAEYASRSSLISLLLWLILIAAVLVYPARGPATVENTIRLSPSQYFKLTLRQARGTTYELEASAPEAGILLGCVDGAGLPPQVVLTPTGIEGIANSKRVPGRELGRVTGPYASPRLECAIANPNRGDVNVRYKLAVR
jgi:hypothetical protein